MPVDPICNMEVEEDEAVVTERDGTIYHFCSEGCRHRFLEGRPGGRQSRYELIIIGGGPAGIAAAVYAATLKIDAFVIAEELGGQAIDSTKIVNYMGFDFITGPDLTEKFRGQLIRSHYVAHLLTRAERIERADSRFQVTTADLETYSALSIVLATGMTRRTLNVPGEEELQRRGIFYAKVQDLTLVQGQDVAVIGGGNSALQVVENLHTVAKEIHLVSDLPLTADPGIVERVGAMRNVHLYEGFVVDRFEGETGLRKVVIRKRAGTETREFAVTGAFIAIGLRPNSYLVADLAKLNDEEEIVIGPDCSTSCPGLFAAGDVTSAYGKRIIIAAGEGAKAALAAKQYILSRRRTRTSR